MHNFQISYLLWEGYVSEADRSLRETVLRREYLPLADGL